MKWRLCKAEILPTENRKFRSIGKKGNIIESLELIFKRKLADREYVLATLTSAPLSKADKCLDETPYFDTKNNMI